MNRVVRVLLPITLLLITAHRLPAPISEIPESPTPSPGQSAEPKPKPSRKPKHSVTKQQRDTATTKPAASGSPASGSTANNAAAHVSIPPYAIPVPGRPNLVWSPYARDKYIDVEGFAPGTEVKDPYAPGKTFLVPGVQQ